MDLTLSSFRTRWFPRFVSVKVAHSASVEPQEHHFCYEIFSKWKVFFQCPLAFTRWPITWLKLSVGSHSIQKWTRKMTIWSERPFPLPIIRCQIMSIYPELLNQCLKQARNDLTSGRVLGTTWSKFSKTLDLRRWRIICFTSLSPSSRMVRWLQS